MANRDRDLETASYDSKPGGSQYTSSGPDQDAPIPPPPPAYQAYTLRGQEPRKKWLSLPSIGYVGHFKRSPAYESKTLSYPARIFGIRRRWFLGGVGLLVLLIFIIGLAAGLSARKSKYDNHIYISSRYRSADSPLPDHSYHFRARLKGSRVMRPSTTPGWAPVAGPTMEARLSLLFRTFCGIQRRRAAIPIQILSVGRKSGQPGIEQTTRPT